MRQPVFVRLLAVLILALPALVNGQLDDYVTVVGYEDSTARLAQLYNEELLTRSSESNTLEAECTAATGSGAVWTAINARYVNLRETFYDSSVNPCTGVNEYRNGTKIACQGTCCGAFADGYDAGYMCTGDYCATFATGHRAGALCRGYRCAWKVNDGCPTPTVWATGLCDGCFADLDETPEPPACCGVHMGAQCMGDECARECKGQQCGRQCAGDSCALDCTGYQCGAYCSGPHCAAQCQGAYCGSGCIGQNCSYLCTEDYCGASCKQAWCASACTGASCGKFCTGPHCAYNCTGNNCGSYCYGRGCAKSCTSTSVSESCGEYAQGEESAQSCSGHGCGKFCVGHSCAKDGSYTTSAAEFSPTPANKAKFALCYNKWVGVHMMADLDDIGNNYQYRTDDDDIDCNIIDLVVPGSVSNDFLTNRTNIEGVGFFCSGDHCAENAEDEFAGSFCSGDMCAKNADGIYAGVACVGTHCAYSTNGTASGAFCYGKKCAEDAEGAWAGAYCIGNNCANNVTGDNAGVCCVGLNCGPTGLPNNDSCSVASGGTAPLALSGTNGLFSDECRLTIDTESSQWLAFVQACASSNNDPQDLYASTSYTPIDANDPNSTCLKVTCSEDLATYLSYYYARGRHLPALLQLYETNARKYLGDFNPGHDEESEEDTAFKVIGYVAVGVVGVAVLAGVAKLAMMGSSGGSGGYSSMDYSVDRSL